VRELRLLDSEEQHRPRPEVERDLARFEFPIDLQRLRQELVDPVGRLAEEEAAVSAGGARSDSTRIEEKNVGPSLGEKARTRTAGEARADDDRVVGLQPC
jgi:hypothetical protein